MFNFARIPETFYIHAWMGVVVADVQHNVPHFYISCMTDYIQLYLNCIDTIQQCHIPSDLILWIIIYKTWSKTEKIHNKTFCDWT